MKLNYQEKTEFSSLTTHIINGIFRKHILLNDTDIIDTMKTTFNYNETNDLAYKLFSVFSTNKRGFNLKTLPDILPYNTNFFNNTISYTIGKPNSVNINEEIYKWIQAFNRFFYIKDEELGVKIYFYNDEIDNYINSLIKESVMGKRFINGLTSNSPSEFKNIVKRIIKTYFATKCGNYNQQVVSEAVDKILRIYNRQLPNDVFDKLDIDAVYKYDYIHKLPALRKALSLMIETCNKHSNVNLKINLSGVRTTLNKGYKYIMSNHMLMYPSMIYSHEGEINTHIILDVVHMNEDDGKNIRYYKSSIARTILNEIHFLFEPIDTRVMSEVFLPLNKDELYMGYDKNKFIQDMKSYQELYDEVMNSNCSEYFKNDIVKRFYDTMIDTNMKIYLFKYLIIGFDELMQYTREPLFVEIVNEEFYNPVLKIFNNDETTEPEGFVTFVRTNGKGKINLDHYRKCRVKAGERDIDRLLYENKKREHGVEVESESFITKVIKKIQSFFK